jgi:hypothetical protein
MSRCLVIVIVALSTSASVLGAESRALAVGARVRVTGPEVGTEPLIGTVVGLEPDAILVRGGSAGATPKRILVAPTTTFEVSGGRKSQAGRGSMLGAAVGAVPGFLMAVGDYNTDDHNPGAVTALGAVAGAAVGAAVGWGLKSEQWLPAGVPSVTAGIAPLRGGVGFTLRIAWGKGQSRSAKPSSEDGR